VCLGGGGWDECWGVELYTNWTLCGLGGCGGGGGVGWLLSFAICNLMLSVVWAGCVRVRLTFLVLCNFAWLALFPVAVSQWFGHAPVVIWFFPALSRWIPWRVEAHGHQSV